MKEFILTFESFINDKQYTSLRMVQILKRASKKLTNHPSTHDSTHCASTNITEGKPSSTTRLEFTREINFLTEKWKLTGSNTEKYLAKSPVSWLDLTKRLHNGPANLLFSTAKTSRAKMFSIWIGICPLNWLKERITKLNSERCLFFQRGKFRIFSNILQSVFYVITYI